MWWRTPTRSPLAPPPIGGEATITGELRTWHRVTLDFEGPVTSEANGSNPFLDYRLNVTLTHLATGESLVIPGFYAADGNAGNTSATSGRIWRARFSPPRVGEWEYSASFRKGNGVAVLDSPSAGQPISFDGASGSFYVERTNKNGKDFRGRGLLEYAGGHYLQFRETGEWYLKGGADSPENFLGYWQFDGTVDHGGAGNDLVDGLHRYGPHVADWTVGDPTWKDGKGKGIIGALNYLASQGMNSVYFLTMNVAGDGREVYPWSSYSERRRFDVSKLAQWEIVFSHMDRLGLMLHVVTQETENDQLLNNGALGLERKLYYRELIARFSHHPALVWNLGEENTNTTAERKAFADYFKALDPYDHPIVLHTFPGSQQPVYTPLLGHPNIDGPSIQIGAPQVHAETKRWLDLSKNNGRPWVVTSDEIGPAGTGVKPDANDYWHDSVRKDALWGNLMAGGAGVEWYFGYSFEHNDLDCEDWSSREHMWKQTRYALEFFTQHLSFVDMKSADQLTSAGNDYCFADQGREYAVYLPGGTQTSLDLRGATGVFQVYWYDPRFGGGLQRSGVTEVVGGGWVGLGPPPSQPDRDWVVLVQKVSELGMIMTDSFESGGLTSWSESVP